MSTLFRHGARILCALIIATLSAHAAMASRRVALVIGNAKYEHADTLTNTINDANAMAALFTKAGFDVVNVQRNVGVVDFKRAVRDFLTATANADIAVVYYSGHGIEVGGTNYLVPVDAKLTSDYDIDDEAIALDRVILATQSAKRLSLIILDACRDNPFLHTAARPAVTTRAIANRLMGVQPVGADTLIAYAAKAGSVSYDGVGSNSPFTTALVKYLAEPGLDIRIALGKVRDDVLASTGNKQEPFVYGSLGGADISLVPPPPAPKVEAAPVVTDPNAAAAHDYEMAERVGARKAWESFLSLHNSGFYADLARAQLAKLNAVEPVKPPEVAKLPDVTKLPDLAKTPDAAKDAAEQARVAAARQAADQRAQQEAARLKAQQEALLQPRVDVAPAPALTVAQICKRDEARLAHLRVDPSAEQVAQFVRELGCEDLRPQVQRLAESLGVETGAKTQAVALTSPVAPVEQSKGVVQNKIAPPSANGAQACKREDEELARLRANPDRESVLRFTKELKCDDLRAQAARLLESVGD
jgi:uncharacterized caspase-like protein